MPGWSGDVASIAADLAREFELRADAVVALMLLDLRRQPHLRGAGRADEAAAERSLRAALPVWTDLLASGRELAPHEVAYLEELGARQAAEGLALDEPLEGLRLWISRAWKIAAEMIGELGPGPKTVAAMTELAAWFTTLDRTVADAVTRGYRGLQEAGMSAPAHPLSRLVDHLVAGSFASDAEALEAAAVLGRDLTVPHGLLLVVPATGNEAPAQCLVRSRAGLRARLADALEGSVRTDPLPHAVFLVPNLSESEWDDVLDLASEVGQSQRTIVVASPPSTGGSAIHAGYREAARLLDAARASRPGVVLGEALFAARLFASAPLDLRAELERRIVAPLRALGVGECRNLVETLAAYHASGHEATEAGKALRKTRQTVDDRLRKIEQVTGLSPRRECLRFGLIMGHAAFTAD